MGVEIGDWGGAVQGAGHPAETSLAALGLLSLVWRRAVQGAGHGGEASVT